MSIRTLTAVVAGALVLAMAGSAIAEDLNAYPARPEEMPPAPRTPWAVSRHPVGDTASHLIDYANTPGYRLVAPALWWLDDALNWDRPLRVRVEMAEPPETPLPAAGWGARDGSPPAMPAEPQATDPAEGEPEPAE